MLLTILQAELATLSELERLLTLELGALKSRSLQGLESLIDAKHRCVDQSTRHFQERCAYLRTCGFETSHAGTENCIESSPDAQRPQLRGIWADLQVLAMRIRHRNVLNGAILAASRNHMDRALAVLQGRDPEASLYGHDAQTTIDSPSQPLARA